MSIARPRIHRLLSVVAAAVTALTLLGPVRAEAASQYFELRGFNGSGDFDPKCASVGGASLENGAPLVSWGCKPFGGNAEQIWRWYGGTNIMNSNSGKCLAIGDSSREPGARAVQWTCNLSKADQHWEKLSAGAGQGWLLRNVNSNYVLAVSGGSRANGTWIVQWPYSNSLEQRWEEHHI
ncbi:hypothetical protein GCM10023263_56030 [Phytohabitans rumicis]